MIDANADGFDKATAAASKYGMIISEETGTKARQFQESLRQIDAVVQGLGIRLAAELLPYLQNLADKFLAFSSNAAQSQTTITGLANAVKALATAVVILAEGFNLAGKAAAVFVLATDPALFVSGKDWLVGLKTALVDLKTPFLDGANIISSIWTPAIKTATKSMDELGRLPTNWRTNLRTRAAEAAPREPEKKSAATKTFNSLIQKAMEEQVAFLQGAQAAEVFRLHLEGLTTAQIKSIEAAKGQLDIIKQQMNAFQAVTPINDKLDESFSNMVTEGADMLEECLSRQDLWNMKLERTLELFKAGAIDADSLNIILAHQNDVWDEMGPKIKANNQVASELGSALKSMFTTAIFHASSFKDALGAVLERLAEVIFQITVLDPLIKSMKEGLSGGGGGLGGLFPGLEAFSAVSGRRRAGKRGPGLYRRRTGARMVCSEYFRERVLPNGAGGATIVYQIDARGADAGAEERIRAALRDTENRAVARAVVTTRELQLRSA